MYSFRAKNSMKLREEKFSVDEEYDIFPLRVQGPDYPNHTKSI